LQLAFDELDKTTEKASTFDLFTLVWFL